MQYVVMKGSRMNHHHSRDVYSVAHAGGRCAVPG
nr:MAG TPA: Glycerophosphoryl diester phosphodiesteraser phosphodiesterase, T [Caudoviricetes sp.]